MANRLVYSVANRLSFEMRKPKLQNMLFPYHHSVKGCVVNQDSKRYEPLFCPLTTFLLLPAAIRDSWQSSY